MFIFRIIYGYSDKKLSTYSEKANRDRFILPLDKDIKFFTDVIDKSIGFFMDV